MSDRIAQIRTLLERNPDDLFLNHALALEYIKAGDEVAAQSAFERNLATDQAYVATYYHLGRLLERKGDTPAAIRTYESGMQAAKTAGDTHAYNELQAAYEDLVY